ncbi:nucleotide pyrophosphohydrolase [Candidatus Undinarchaeota archaeon]
MPDSTQISELKEQIKQFVKARDWEKFHNPKDLSLSISVEAAELLENFQWEDTKPPSEVKKDPRLMDNIREELADVMIFSICLANALDIDISEIITEKIRKNHEKYPAEEYKGIAKK